MDHNPIELPRYRCHKEVHALKIKAITAVPPSPDNCVRSFLLEFEDEGYIPRRMTYAYVHKHSPHVGGYYVVYKDGYESFSPAQAFEEGHTRI